MDGFWWFSIIGTILAICAMRAMGLAWWLSTLLTFSAVVIVLVLTAIAVLWGEPSLPL